MIDVKPRELAILVIGPFNEPFDYLFEDSFHKISTGQIVDCLLYTSPSPRDA